MSAAETESITSLPPAASWSVPVGDGAAVEVSAAAGEAVTIVGANGAGKSALATWMVREQPQGAVKRVIAHRKIWFMSSGTDISPAEREQQGQWSRTWEQELDSRYLDRVDGKRASIALFDLLGMVNAQNQQAVELYDAGATAEQVNAVTGDRLLPKLNRILGDAGLEVTIELTATQTFRARSATLGLDYPISEMSDGEKSALLLAAEILTASANQVVIVDEPERHLHRSISASLVEAIIGERSDCAFVVLTHDLDLAASLASRGRTYLLTGCRWEGQSLSSWEMRPVSSDEPIPELARRAILGGRQKILFIEGDVGSLDLSLYRVLFPEWTCSPVGGCESVIRSVTGIRASDGFHWVQALGIVDGDGRSFEERTSLRERGILALPVNEIESIYYLPEVLDSVSEAHAAVLGESADYLVRQAKAAAIGALSVEGSLERFARKLAKDEVTRKLIEHAPEEVTDTDVEISFPSPYPEILSRLRSLLETDDYEGLVKAVSIRDSAVRGRVASALRFASFDLYERAARTRILNDDDLRSSLRKAIGDVPE